MSDFYAAAKLRNRKRHSARTHQKMANARAARARNIAASPAPDYPPIIDRSEPFLRITVETSSGAELWLIYPGKRRQHGVTVNGKLLVIDGKARHSLTAVYAELRRRGAMVERGLRLPAAAADPSGRLSGAAGIAGQLQPAPSRTE